MPSYLIHIRTYVHCTFYSIKERNLKVCLFLFYDIMFKTKRKFKLLLIGTILHFMQERHKVLPSWSLSSFVVFRIELTTEFRVLNVKILFLLYNYLRGYVIVYPVGCKNLYLAIYNLSYNCIALRYDL